MSRRSELTKFSLGIRNTHTKNKQLTIARALILRNVELMKMLYIYIMFFYLQEVTIPFGTEGKNFTGHLLDFEKAVKFCRLVQPVS